MYSIYRNNRKTVKQFFTTYEKARQYVRKLIRRNDVTFQGSNPMIGTFGYSIKRV